MILILLLLGNDLIGATIRNNDLLGQEPIHALHKTETQEVKLELTVANAAKEAAERGLPLVVWVGGYNHPTRQRIRAVHVDAPSFWGDRTRGVVACPLYNGWPRSRTLLTPRQAHLGAVLTELDGWWHQPATPQMIYTAGPGRSGNC